MHLRIKMGYLGTILVLPLGVRIFLANSPLDSTTSETASYTDSITNSQRGELTPCMVQPVTTVPSSALFHSHSQNWAMWTHLRAGVYSAKTHILINRKSSTKRCLPQLVKWLLFFYLRYFKGIVQKKSFVKSHIWYMMGCGTAHFGRRGRETT